MFAHLFADDAAVGPAAVRTRAYPPNRMRPLLAISLAAVTLTGCIPNAPLVGADPADPAAKVAATGYRSTIAPYSNQRPSAPAPWREQNDRVAPAPKSGE